MRGCVLYGYKYMLYIGRQKQGMQQQLGSFLNFCETEASREDPRTAGVQRLYNLMFFLFVPNQILRLVDMQDRVHQKKVCGCISASAGRQCIMKNFKSGPLPK
ncbi:hypothetical protein TWF569_002771 [Orbilia oligospora]|uniref:Uncharacterized protein n=1 Tax=Orbilia oligospora TaxID=2813651 RepID=A0A7C8N386_ORBOL|nr:hypothetical protein TWF102_002616 [Orbilia oligospora]KAF3079891.1 hypothetical protein TWF706_003084 [Orbilia oligospora]KAF3112443.1 hypothetical protein TWF103_003218 [Orbilia oligospora]KAF3121247.1 hypothetical protein TWF569_002771 [Orbilia oligospora]KAF3139353.1 hypothetical protein TWF594_006649 [Orbilia oligospora]